MFRPRLLVEKIRPYLHSDEAIVITGMRRAGKTALLLHLYESLETRNKIFLDLENPLNRRHLESNNYEQVKKAFEFLGINFSSRPYVFLDEIQFVKNLPSVAKYLIDHYRVKFFLTGSASFYLKNLFTESLEGRKYIFELFPLTFSEFLVFKDTKFSIPDDPRDVTDAIFDALSAFYDEYTLYGGFPGVASKTSLEEKKLALEDIFSSFFNMEVLQLGDFRRNEIVRDLMLLLMQRVGSLLDIQKLSKELGVSRPTLHEYIAFLEGTYFIKTIRPFSSGRDTEIRKMPKIYVCDSGLANHLARVDTGSLFENSVFQNLRLKGDVNYYQRKSGVELDFIVNRSTAYEVKVTPSSSDVKRTGELANELGLKIYWIVSKKYSTLPNVTYAFLTM